MQRFSNYGNGLFLPDWAESKFSNTNATVPASRVQGSTKDQMGNAVSVGKNTK